MAGNIRLNDNKGLSRMNSCLGAGRLCYLPTFVTIISVSAAKNFLHIDSFSGVRLKAMPSPWLLGVGGGGH